MKRFSYILGIVALLSLLGIMAAGCDLSGGGGGGSDTDVTVIVHPPAPPSEGSE